jgi:tripeptide aminopeptidase
MNLERLVKHTLAIQSIPAPTFSESRRARYLQTALDEIGVRQTTIDHVGNLTGRLPGGKAPALVVCAHMDHVFDEGSLFAASRHGQKLVGPGVGDNAVALAMLIEIAQAFEGANLAGDVWLAATVAEEGLGNLHGMEAIVARFGSSVAGYIVLEGIGLGQIYHQGLPSRRYRVRVRAPGGHSWIHAGRTSAVHVLLTLGHHLLELPLSEDPRTILNIGTIEGGRSVNSIAGEAHMDMDIRSERASTLDATCRQVLRVIHEHEQPNCELVSELIGSRPGGRLDPDHPLVLVAKSALHGAGERRIILSAGSTDANLPLSRGLPALCIGLTYGGEAHSPQEYVEIAPLTRGFAALSNIIRGVFQ